MERTVAQAWSQRGMSLGATRFSTSPRSNAKLNVHPCVSSLTFQDIVREMVRSELGLGCNSKL